MPLRGWRSWVIPSRRPHAKFDVRNFSLIMSWRLNFLMALLSAIALTAAALIGYLIEEYQPPDAARVEIEAVPQGGSMQWIETKNNKWPWRRREPTSLSPLGCRNLPVGCGCACEAGGAPV